MELKSYDLPNIDLLIFVHSQNFSGPERVTFHFSPDKSMRGTTWFTKPVVFPSEERVHKAIGTHLKSLTRLFYISTIILFHGFKIALLRIVTTQVSFFLSHYQSFTSHTFWVYLTIYSAWTDLNFTCFMFADFYDGFGNGRQFILVGTAVENDTVVQNPFHISNKSFRASCKMTIINTK